MNNSPEAVRLRIKLVSIFLLLAAVWLLVQFFRVQVLKHDYYGPIARGIYLTSRSTQGQRGEIYDRNGYLLVGNSPRKDIFCTPFNLPEKHRRQVAQLCSRFFGKSFAFYNARLERYVIRKKADGETVKAKNNYFLIARAVTLEDSESFRNELHKIFLSEKERKQGKTRARRFPTGFIVFRDTTERIYPNGSLASNILGYINTVDDRAIPQSGIEKQLNREMRPRQGKETYIHSRDGVPLEYDPAKTFGSRDGRDIYLTISVPIQAILEQELDKAYEKWRPDTIYAAIADPATGEILALAQRPSFNPGDRSTFAANAVNTRIAQDSYEPGSVIKPFTVGKALDWGVVSPQNIIDCENGRWIYLRRPLTDSHNYDKLTVSGVIQKSSNIGTAKIALQLGEERLYTALKSFGFGERTGLPFHLESRGYLPSPKRWDGLSITRFPIGYGIRVSPLQLIRAYCALAHKGVLPDLHLVKKMVDTQTGETIQRKPSAGRQVFEHDSARKDLVDMMITVTEPGGTATRAAVPGYHVAGKTGTSRKYIPGRGYSPGAYYASFVGFVPAKNPRMVMLVTFDHPRGASYGGTVAGPVFRNTASRVLKYWNVPPDFTVPVKSAGR